MPTPANRLVGTATDQADGSVRTRVAPAVGTKHHRAHKAHAVYKRLHGPRLDYTDPGASQSTSPRALFCNGGSIRTTIGIRFEFLFRRIVGELHYRLVLNKEVLGDTSLYSTISKDITAEIITCRHY